MKRVLALAMAVSLALSTTAFAAEWKQDEKGWWYENDDGSYKVNEWFNDPATGYRYHANTFGYIDTGLTKINNQWYNFRPTGELTYNWYDEANGALSDNEGKAYLSTDGGFLGGQTTVYFNGAMNTLYLVIVNCRNIPLSFDGYGELSGNGVYETWYEYDGNSSGAIGKTVTINPGEYKVISLVTEDLHAINFPAATYSFKAHYHLQDGSSYYVYTDVQCADNEDWVHKLYYSHID